MPEPSKSQLRIALACAAILVAAVTVLQIVHRQPTPVASADGVRISSDAFRDEYVAWILATGVSDSAARREAFLKDMVATRLLVAEARSQGIDREPHYLERTEALGRKLRIELYLAEILKDSVVVTEQDVRELYARAQTQIGARHLYARTEEEAWDLRARLQDGESFETLAKEVFRDPALRDSGGRLPEFTFDEMDPDFEDAAFALPVGQVSTPVRTAQGYSILRVDDRFTRPIITETEFQARRAAYEAFASRRKHAAARRRLARQLAAESALHIDESTLGALFARITDAQPDLESSLAQRTLLEWGDPPTIWSVAMFRDRARFASAQQRAAVRTIADLRDFIAGLVVNEILTLKAAGQANTPAYNDGLKQALDRYIAQRAAQRLEPGVSLQEVQEYYDGAPRTEFRVPLQVSLTWEYFDTEAAASAARRIESTAPAQFFTREQLGPWAEAIFDSPEHSILGPIPAQSGWVMVQTGEQRGARRQTLEEARPSIEAMLRESKRRDARRIEFDRLSTRYNIEIDGPQLAALSLDTG